MTRERRSWIPALLVGVLLVMAVGIPASGQAEPRVVTRTITVPAGAFAPTSNEWMYGNSGRSLYLTGGSGKFTAPLFFPKASVTITKMTIYGYDNNAGASVCVTLYRTRPKDPLAPEDQMGKVCTLGAYTLDPRILWTAAFSPNQIISSTGPYLWLEIGGVDSLKFYAVAITYQY